MLRDGFLLVLALVLGGGRWSSPLARWGFSPGLLTDLFLFLALVRVSSPPSPSLSLPLSSPSLLFPTNSLRFSSRARNLLRRRKRERGRDGQGRQRKHACPDHNQDSNLPAHQSWLLIHYHRLTGGHKTHSFCHPLRSLNHLVMTLVVGLLWLSVIAFS